VAQLTEAAFGDFYGREARAVWTYAYRVTGNPADADDVVQEAFVRVLRAEVGALDQEELRRYVFRVAGNVMADRWRRAKRDRTWAAREAAPDRVESPDVSASLDVTRTFSELKPRERALLWLAYVEEDSHEQIAGALGLKRDSVKVLLFRARARLRDLLKRS
jgi:RNA polymerase sigma-70 factor (ECF subfamily)